MPQDIAHSLWPEPLPQVGAVLYLDTEIGPDPPDYTGGRHWKLTGSCVLVAPDRILTVGHTLAARNELLPPGRYAAFFPYVGLVPITEGLDWEPDQVPGDNLALATLRDTVNDCLPLRPRKIRSSFKYSGKAFVCGYGRWINSPLGVDEGLQQQHLVPLGPPARRAWRHYDNLDLSWSSRENSGMAAGLGNSGGPVLLENLGVIGINREVTGDQQASSWITWDRINWLWSALNLPVESEEAAENAPRQSQLTQKTAWKLLELTALQGEVTNRFDVPEGTRRVRATLNASPGMRLRMDFIPAVADNQAGTGRFLVREIELAKNTKEVIISVGRAPRSPYQAGQKILAQLCVLFT